MNKPEDTKIVEFAKPEGQPFMIGKQRQKILDAASALIHGDRAEAYGDALAMHRRIAAGWSEILGHEVKPHEAALCMAWVKIARLVVSGDHADSYVDLVAYGALAGEIQQRDSENRNSAARASGHVSDRSV
jgi:hypothetical protein